MFHSKTHSQGQHGSGKAGAKQREGSGFGMRIIILRLSSSPPTSEKTKTEKPQPHFPLKGTRRCQRLLIISSLHFHNVTKPKREAGYQKSNFQATVVFNKWLPGFAICKIPTYMETRGNTLLSCTYTLTHTELSITCHRESHHYWMKAS